ncbi:MAG TPA: tRNA glutamyl-Q(34) synthetase GluQRS [Wenzhouxiangellaceae bacterium]|nr:tRNA glutamyl-Q(34) synthetase GluQRS [Wenzhouxiangellaceae bacterium]
MDARHAQNKHDSNAPRAYRGRFAPSPTGPLHFGSLLAAVGSFLQARTNDGVWLVRIEDIDPPREVAGAANDQLETLARFGMLSDEPVVYQSRASARHKFALSRLRDEGLAFDCACTRRDLPASGVYPGTCRNGIPPGKNPRSVRFRVPASPVELVDRVFGPSSHRLSETCGDFVIRRADGLFAYQLAVVVDDIAAGATEIVRGSDLLDSSPRQQVIFEALAAPVPRWMHLPLVVASNGIKLSKSSGADPIRQARPANALALVLEALGHRPPPGLRSLESLWTWAIGHWTPERIPTEPFEI